MKKGVTAIAIGVALVGLWIWGAEVGGPGPTTSASVPSSSAREVPAAPPPVVERPTPTAVVSETQRVATPVAQRPPVEPKRQRSPTETRSPSVAETERVAGPASAAPTLSPSQRVEPGPSLPVEAAPSSSSPEMLRILTALESLRTPEEASPAATTPATVPTSSGTASSEESEEITAIRHVLDRYKRMYDELDASEATSIWPSVDSRALTRMFSRLDRQTLEFDGCVFGLWETGGAADCTGWLSYVPRVGNSTPRKERHSWTIELTRGDQGWRILKVTAR